MTQLTDDEIFDQIRTLIDTEHAIRSSGGPVDEARLASLDQTLDQCWDLLRQRRARSEFGERPADATIRNVDTVEHYRQ